MSKRKALSIKLKVEIIQEYEKNVLQSKKALAARFNLPESTLKGILKNKNVIMNASKDTDSKRSRIQSGRFEKLESALITWFNEMRASNVPIDGVILKEKARTLAEKHGIENFSASWGWLEKLKRRHGLSHRRITGESASVDDNDVTQWLQNLPMILKDFKPKDIFNCDETGLFFKLMPDKTLSYKGDPCHGGRKSKERLTILFCTNSDGSEKMKPLVIGKSRKPRCFKNIKKLPCDYRNSKKAWMTSQIFIDFLKQMDDKFRKQKRKVLLLMDQCPSHPDVKDLSFLKQIEVKFLPANSTSKLQPLDLGIIKNFKINYRKSLIRRFISDKEQKKEARAISILDAMHLTASSWESVTSQTIKNCFRKCGFSQDQSTSSTSESDFESVWECFNDEDWDEMFMDESINFKDYVECDEKLLLSELRTAEEIFEDINNEEVSEEDDEDESNVPAVITFSEASAALNTLKNYVHQNDYSQNSSKALSDLEKDIFSFRRLQRQTNITSFFEKSDL